MKKHLWIIKSIIYAVIIELLCFVPMYFTIKSSKYEVDALISLIIIFVVFAALFSALKGRVKQRFLYNVPIIAVHLLFVPLRVFVMLYINRNSHKFLADLPIVIMELLIAIFFATLLLSDYTLSLIDLLRNRVIKAPSKSFPYKWLVKGIIFTFITEIILFALFYDCIGTKEMAFGKLIVYYPIWVIVAIAFSFIKGRAERPLFYNLSVLTIHVAFDLVKANVLYSLFINEPHLVFGANACTVITEVLFIALLIFDTIYCLIKHYSQNEANAQV